MNGFWIDRIEEFLARHGIHVGHPPGHLLEIHLGFFHSFLFDGHLYLLSGQLPHFCHRWLRLSSFFDWLRLGTRRFGSYPSANLGRNRHLQTERISLGCKLYLLLNSQLTCTKLEFLNFFSGLRLVWHPRRTGDHRTPKSGPSGFFSSKRTTLNTNRGPGGSQNASRKSSRLMDILSNPVVPHPLTRPSSIWTGRPAWATTTNEKGETI